MIDRIPVEVIDNMGFNIEDKAERRLLEKKFKPKTDKEIMDLVPSVLQMKLDRDPIWKISFKHGLTISEVKSIVSGDFLDNGPKPTAGYLFKDDVEEKYGEQVFMKITRNSFPYAAIRTKKNKDAGMKEYNESDIIVAKFFEDSNINVVDTDEWKSFDYQRKNRLKYRVVKSGISVDPAGNIVPKDKEDELKAIIENIDVIGKPGRKRKNNDARTA